MGRLDLLDGYNLTEVEDIEIDVAFCMKSMPCCHSGKIKINGEWKIVRYMHAQPIYDICKRLKIQMPTHFDYLFDKDFMERKGYKTYEEYI